MKTRYISASLIVTTALICRIYSIEANSSDTIPQLSCSYASKFEQCAVANQNGSSRSIEEFACIASQNYSEILDQIILDEKFREIQEEKINFLDALDADKQEVVDDPNRVVDDIVKNFSKEWYYHKKYQEICTGWILAERVSCSETVPITVASLRIDDPELDDECMALANLHLDMYSLVAYDIAKENKSIVVNDAHQEYFQWVRDKYSDLLSTMQFIIWSTERINPTHYTSDPLQ